MSHSVYENHNNNSLENITQYEFLGTLEEFSMLISDIQDVEGFIDRSYSEKIFLLLSNVDIETIVKDEFKSKIRREIR